MDCRGMGGCLIMDRMLWSHGRKTLIFNILKWEWKHGLQRDGLMCNNGSHAVESWAPVVESWAQDTHF